MCPPESSSVHCYAFCGVPLYVWGVYGCTFVRGAFCCQTAISLLTWGQKMNSALSRNSLKVLGYNLL